MRLKKETGFTLIELMIAVAVVGILASIAYPSYTDHVRKARRADAQGALMGLSNAMERFFTQNSTYLGAAGTSGTPANTGAPWIYPAQTPTGGGTVYYNLTIQAATATIYTLRATPINAQAGDGMLELNNTGARRWDRDNDTNPNEAGENCWEKTC